MFGVFIVIDFWEVTDRVTGRPRTLEKCAHVTHVDPIQPNRDALFRLEKNRPSPFFFSSSPLFVPPLLSHRAPVRGTLPCTAPCPPRRISQTTMITATNPARHRRLPGTLCPGTCRDMSDPRGKSTEGPCWTPRREPCSGSQVRSSQSSCCPVVGWSFFFLTGR